MQFTTARENTSKTNKVVLFVPSYLVGTDTKPEMKYLDLLDYHFYTKLNDIESYPALSNIPQIEPIDNKVNPYEDPNKIKFLTYGLKELHISDSDIEKLLVADGYIKKVLGLAGGNIVRPDEKILEVENNSILNSLTIPNQLDHTYITDVIMSNTEKPYGIYVTKNILFVVMYKGFGNLLLSNYELFNRFVLSDIVREYQRTFGTQELHSSSLFNVYLKTLDRSICS